jgi:hypothetical protein
MYKMLLPLLVLALSNWAFAADAPLYKKTFKAKGEGSADSRVIETFREALNSPKPNKVKELVIRLTDELEDAGTVNKLSKRDLFVIEGGKSSAAEYGTQFLVGIPVSMKGTGLIETHSLYFNVNYSVNMATGKETVFIEEQVELVPVR